MAPVSPLGSCREASWESSQVYSESLTRSAAHASQNDLQGQVPFSPETPGPWASDLWVSVPAPGTLSRGWHPAQSRHTVGLQHTSCVRRVCAASPLFFSHKGCRALPQPQRLPWACGTLSPQGGLAALTALVRPLMKSRLRGPDCPASLSRCDEICAFNQAPGRSLPSLSSPSGTRQADEQKRKRWNLPCAAAAEGSRAVRPACKAVGIMRWNCEPTAPRPGSDVPQAHQELGCPQQQCEQQPGSGSPSVHQQKNRQAWRWTQRERASGSDRECAATCRNQAPTSSWEGSRSIGAVCVTHQRQEQKQVALIQAFRSRHGATLGDW